MVPKAARCFDNGSPSEALIPNQCLIARFVDELVVEINKNSPDSAKNRIEHWFEIPPNSKVGKPMELPAVLADHIRSTGGA